MDALSDPRAFMSANQKRDDKLKEMGIEESETSKAAATGGAKPAPEEEIKRGWKHKNIDIDLLFNNFIFI